ncbi:MAG TPA: LodA/GoxA family CTQ-dependent oxidase, partial [Blastocatellia bacterium]|nr:LodA/GoxA family CTQ-dependent oxidase [Blastocatellia bacterium]
KDGKLVREITKKDGLLTWSVHLANRKSAWKQFDGLNPNAPLRNASIADRNRLIIDPGPRSLTGASQSAQFNTGAFQGVTVPLGEIRTDAQCRLTVLGGFGHSASPSNAPLTTYANNNGWHDDTSDGPVTAVVTLKGTTTPIQAAGAWVMCGPPKFAPQLLNVITLYDTLLQVAVDKLGVKVSAQPSFTNDIYPILARALGMTWVSGMVSSAHAHRMLAAVIPPPGSPSARKIIFDRLRDPALPHDQESDADMPMLWSDFYTEGQNEPLTRLQYANMKKWMEGNFINDWSGPPKPATKITPAGLDRAALECCVGGAFYPGIETSWMTRDVFNYIEPFRLDHATLQAGDVTKQMAVPWQADFYDCTQDDDYAWWPAQRPDDVFPDGEATQVPWIRDLINSFADMVRNWNRLGFIVKKGRRYVETERIE